MKHSRPYRKREDRRVWVYSEPNADLRPRDIAQVLARAALEAAAEAHRAELDADGSGASAKGTD